MSKYALFQNEDSNISISDSFKSWYLKSTESIEKFLVEYATGGWSILRFRHGDKLEQTGKTVYTAIVPLTEEDDDTIFALNNPSEIPVVLYSVRGAQSKYDHYDKGAKSYVDQYLGKGLEIYVASDDLSVIRNLKLLRFSPVKTQQNKYGIEIFNDKRETVFCGAELPLKIIESRFTRYSENPRYFYRGSDDIQGNIYKENNYINYSNAKKEIGYISGIPVGTAIYKGNGYADYIVNGIAAKISKHTIMTGFLEMWYSGNCRYYDMMGKDVTYRCAGYNNGIYGIAGVGHSEQSCFAIIDVTNY